MNNPKEIPLTQGKVTIVDASDYDWLSQWKWFAGRFGAIWYGLRNEGQRPHRRTVFMHRVIMQSPEDMQTDHRNGDGLDNRRVNLRICTRQENMRNQKLRKNNTSGHKGVHWYAAGKQWQAYVGINGQQVYLGLYDDINEAIAARKAKEIELFGEFSRLNSV